MASATKMATCRHATIGATGLWLVAVGLMAWDTIDGSADLMGRWALLVGLAAAAWTLTLGRLHCRRVILEVMAWEHWRQGEPKPPARAPAQRSGASPPGDRSRRG